MPFHRLAVVLLVLLLTACAEPAPTQPSGPAVVYVIGRGWHTDIALPVAEISGKLQRMAAAYPGATVLTFGFGERQFLITRTPSIGLMLSAMLPSQSAVLMTALKAPPETAFGPSNVVTLHASPAALREIEDALWQAIEHQPDGAPVWLAEGPYPGSTFYAGSDTYAGYFTCNTWTAKMLHAGGLSGASHGVLFSGEVMRLARAIAARQGELPVD